MTSAAAIRSLIVAFGILTTQRLVANAQVPQPVSTTLAVVAHQGDGYALELKSSTAGGLLPAAWFGSDTSPGTDQHRYRLYQVDNLGTAHPTILDLTNTFLDSNTPVQVIGSDMVVVQLKQALHSDQNYLLEATDDQHNLLDVVITSSPGLATSDPQHLRDHLFVNANVPLRMDYQAGSVTVTYDPGRGDQYKHTYQVTSITAGYSQGIVLTLSEKLPAGTADSLQIAVNGIKDSYGTSVTVSGTVASVPSAPTDATKDYLSVAISAIAATHTAPTFSATGTFAPVHTATNAIVLTKHGFRRIDFDRPDRRHEAFGNLHFDPSIVFDVGSSNATTTNSVTIPSEFIYPKLFGLPKSRPGAPEQISSKPSNVSVMNFMGGLRSEVDTANGGLNLMGEGRIEWYFSKLFHPASRWQARVSALNPTIRSTLNLPTNGFTITPYVQYDSGRHVTSESIANAASTLPSVSIPTFAISRLYFGSQATGQIGRNTLTFDGSWVDLFDPETAAFTQNQITLTRAISGLQPHAKGTYAFGIDQEKHFSLTIAWENGRSAPSFAYLNKVTAGIQVVF